METGKDVRIIIDLAASGDLKRANHELDQMVKNLETIDKLERQRQSTLGRTQAGVASEIQKVEQSIKNLESSQKKLDTEQQKSLSEQKKKLQELANVHQELGKAAEKNSQVQEAISKRQIENTEKLKREAKALRDELAKTNDPQAIKSLEVQIQDVSQRMRESRSEAKRLAQQNKELDNSYVGLVLRNQELRQTINRIPWNDTTGQLDRLKREFRANTEALKRFDNELGQSFRNVGNYEEAIKNVVHNLGNLGPGLQGLTGGGGGGSILGLAGGALGGIGAIGGPALAAIGGAVAGFDTLLDSAKAVNEELTKTSAVTKLQGQELKTVTAELRAQSTVFNQDYNEGLRAANAAVQSFGDNFSDAIDEINRGLLEGANINGDYLDQIREYAPIFEDAGLSLKTLVDTAIIGAQEGIFSDKAADAVKEASIRLRELTPATRSALQGIGLVVDDIEKGLRTGTLSIADVISQVSQRLNDLPKQSSAVGTAIADIFGGPGEDAGIRYLRRLVDINKELDTSTENLNFYQQQQVRQLEAQETLNKAQVEFSSILSGLGTTMSVFSDTALAGIITGLNNLLSLFLSNSEEARIFGERINTLNKAEASEGIERTKERLQELGEQLENLKTGLGGGIRNIGLGLVGGEPAIRQKIDEVSAAIVKESENLARLHARLEEIENPTIRLTEHQKEQIRQYRNLIDAARDYKTALTPEEAKQLADAIQAQADAAKNLELALFKARNQLEKIASLGPEVGDALKKALGDDKFLADFKRIFDQDLPEAIREFQAELLVFDPSKITDGLEKALEEQIKVFERKKKEYLDKKKELQKEEKKGDQKFSDEQLEIIRASQDIAADLIFSFFDIRIANLDRELAAVEANEQRKLAAVEGNEQAQESIRAQADQQRRRIQQEQVRAQQAAAIFSILLSRAEAIAKLFAIHPILGAFGVAAVGAVIGAQLKQAQSAAIPQFFTGVDSSPEGPALVGEKGFELLERAGKFAFTNDGPQLTYLRAGTKVYSHEQTQKLIREQPEILRNALQIKNDTVAAHDRRQEKLINRELKLQLEANGEKLLKGFEKAVDKMVINQSTIDEEGFKRFMKRGNTRVQIMNKLRKW